MPSWLRFGGYDRMAPHLERDAPEVLANVQTCQGGRQRYILAEVENAKSGAWLATPNPVDVEANR